jgi:hypothetical protein
MLAFTIVDLLYLLLGVFKLKFNLLNLLFQGIHLVFTTATSFQGF